MTYHPAQIRRALRRTNCPVSVAPPAPMAMRLPIYQGDDTDPMLPAWMVDAIGGRS